MAKFERIYRWLPVWTQNLLVSIYGRYWHWARFGGNYQQHEDSYRQREGFSDDEWEAWQKKRLKDLVGICVRHVPYYKKAWSQETWQAALKGELSALPLLEKTALRQDSGQFLRQDQKPLIKFPFHTSGSTGTPISVVYTLSELRNSLALREVRSANWAGVSFDEPRATFSGRIIEHDPDEETHIYRYNRPEKQIYFSAFHLKPETAPRYVEALWQHGTKWLTGYAVSYYLLAKFILAQGLQVPALKAVITTSEKVTPQMRETMQQAYGCRVFEEYSTVENALFASECEAGRLHVSPDVGIVEILHPDGSPCLPGEGGEVVTTCLARSYQPLVRFRLGDLAAWDPEPCPCGRNMPVIKEVVGRIEDVVTGPDGRQLVRFHGIFVDQPNVVKGQIIQETLDTFSVRVVPSPNFGETDVENIIQRMKQRLGDNVQVVVETVSEIPLTKAGKFRAVISKVR